MSTSKKASTPWTEEEKKNFIFELLYSQVQTIDWSKVTLPEGRDKCSVKNMLDGEKRKAGFSARTKGKEDKTTPKFGEEKKPAGLTLGLPDGATDDLDTAADDPEPPAINPAKKPRGRKRKAAEGGAEEEGTEKPKRQRAPKAKTEAKPKKVLEFMKPKAKLEADPKAEAGPKPRGRPKKAVLKAQIPAPAKEPTGKPGKGGKKTDQLVTKEADIVFVETPAGKEENTKSLAAAETVKADGGKAGTKAKSAFAPTVEDDPSDEA